jgi:hypothetical protein
MSTRIFKILLQNTALVLIAIGLIAAQTGLFPVIQEPHTGSILQGVVTINGSSNLSDFASYEVAFAYVGDTTGTWFQIHTSGQSVNKGELALWDTTTITDGDYSLRLRVFQTTGNFKDMIVSNLRVRNYTPIETPTLAGVSTAAAFTPVATITVTPYPAATALPRNPAALTPMDVSISVGVGGLIAILFLSILGIYLWQRRK